ncbi:dentin sialophosphoprotein-like [Cloeon dipterum]|uniref:dentin sialophosphoprotein-like n=1 Tax=Cloeon dipterum TaxID=197152 RepID=UPI0032200091
MTSQSRPSPEKANQEGRNYVVIEWFQSKKTQVCLVDEVNNMDDPPKKGTKKYNVISGKDKSGRLETKPALILHGPGTFCEMQEMEKLRKLDADCVFPGERPKRIRRLPAKNLETADEEDRPRSPSKKMGKKAHGTSNMQIDLLNAISRAKEVNLPSDEDENNTSLDGPGATQENLGKERKKASKKCSTQEKRAPKTNTVTKTGAANKDTTTQKVNIHSSQERSRPLAKSAGSMRLDGGRGNNRPTAGSSKMPEKGKEKVQFTESLAAGTGDGEDSDTSFDGPGATQENVGKESKKASKKYSTQEKRAPKTNTVTKTGAAKNTTTQKVNIHSSQERSRPLAKSAGSMRLDGGRGNYRSTAGSSKMPEKGKEKVQFTESLAAGTGDGEDSDTSFDGPGATQENVGKESKKASKKCSTQEKRPPKTNTVTKTGAANKDTTTQKVNIHSSQERSRPLAKSGDSMRLDGGRGNYRSTAGSSKMLEKEHDEDADSTDHREVETHSSEERRRQIQREWSSDGLFSDWDDAVVQGESSHEVDPLPSRSSQFVGKKPSLASEDRSCCCSVEMLQLIHVLDSKIDLLLKSSAAMRGTQAASDEPDLLQIVCNNYNYIGNGYVLLRGRYASVDMYTSQRPARFVTQMTKAVFGDDILSRSRLNAERGDFLALDCKLVECIFLSQRAYCEMNNLTPLTMAATRRIVSNVCQRANPNTSVWTSHGYRQLTEVVPTADCDDASHTDTE